MRVRKVVKGCKRGKVVAIGCPKGGQVGGRCGRSSKAAGRGIVRGQVVVKNGDRSLGFGIFRVLTRVFRRVAKV